MFASVGFTAISSSISNEITRILPINQIGSGIGIVQLMQFFGAGLGVTISGLLITIQEGLSLEMVYRNIFICFSIVNIMASFIYGFYLRRARLKEPS
jgi:DHA2 family metal-tetracycline-proton antiporter-like MFS transporter